MNHVAAVTTVSNINPTLRMNQSREGWGHPASAQQTTSKPAFLAFS